MVSIATRMNGGVYVLEFPATKVREGINYDPRD